MDLIAKRRFQYRGKRYRPGERFQLDFAGGQSAIVAGVARQVSFQDQLLIQTDRIKSAQVIAKAIIDGRQMGKLADLGQRIAATKKHHEQEADEISAQLDDINKRAPAVFENAKSIASQQKADVDALDSELRQLSNSLPLAQ